MTGCKFLKSKDFGLAEAIYNKNMSFAWFYYGYDYTISDEAKSISFRLQIYMVNP